MARFMVTSVFEVRSGKAPLGPEVLYGWWGPGLEFSYHDGRTLTVVARLKAGSPVQARGEALIRTVAAWTRLTGGGQLELVHQQVIRVGMLGHGSLVPAGLPGTEPQAPPAARRYTFGPAAPGKAARAASTVLRGVLGRRRPGPSPEQGGPDEEGGGLAGVREPRRPKPSPGHLSVAHDLPDELLDRPGSRRRPRIYTSDAPSGTEADPSGTAQGAAPAAS